MITDYNKILDMMEDIDPIQYSVNRNYVDGSVSMLSPYISRGVLSTKRVLNFLISKGYEFKEIEKFIQELCWRDYWQLLWKKRDINKDFFSTRDSSLKKGISISIINNCTGIKSIDDNILKLYKTGYMHNHIRMYVASMATNISHCHWLEPAKWMYYYLLDADWGSNALSWQWVSGAFNNRKYIANQTNINKFTKSEQVGTFLDDKYDFLTSMKIPNNLRKVTSFDLTTKFPEFEKFNLNPNLPTCIYNFYNLDPEWKKELDCQRVLLLEPSIFNKYPISKKSIDFIIKLSKNIPKIKIFVGEFDDLVKRNSTVYYKEHPLNYNYSGIEESRDWIFFSDVYYTSFFKYWKVLKKELVNMFDKQIKIDF